MLNFRLKWMFLLCLAAGCLAGCFEPQAQEAETYLVQVGETTLTTQAFQRAMEIHKTAYDYADAVNDPAVIQKARRQVLQETIERMILLERARELGLRVDPAELDAAVQEIRQGYPEGEFENALLESAVSLKSWRKALADRLLLEKVIQRDLAEKIRIPDEAVQAYIDTHSVQADPAADAGRGDLNRNIREHLRREKVAASYPEWVEKLQKKYTIQINESDWQKIVGG